MTKPIDIGQGYNQLAEAMKAEGVYQIRFYDCVNQFSVQMKDGRIGQGVTPRAAMEAATPLGEAA